MENQPLSEATGEKMLKQLRVIKRVVVGFSLTFLIVFVALIAMLVTAGLMVKEASEKFDASSLFGASLSLDGSSANGSVSDDTVKQQVCGSTGVISDYAKQQGWCN